MGQILFGVIPGLVPGIHVFQQNEDVDGRVKPGHDGEKLETAA
jgi:hypothetical protein